MLGPAGKTKATKAGSLTRLVHRRKNGASMARLRFRGIRTPFIVRFSSELGITERNIRIVVYLLSLRRVETGTDEPIRAVWFAYSFNTVSQLDISY